MSPCIFCEILAGRAPASFVYQDDICSAFMDIRPINPGHVLVIPSVHAVLLEQLAPEIGAHLFRIGQRMASALRQSSVRCQGINLFLADGEAAGQEVLHVHLHVIPRFVGDGFGLRFGPHYGRLASRTDLDALAAQIRSRIPRSESAQ